MRREIFLWIAFTILFFCMRLNAADHFFSLRTFKLTDKYLMAGNNIFANLEINGLNQSMDVSLPRGRSNLPLSACQFFHFNLEDSNAKLNGVSKSEPDAKIEKSTEDSKSLQKPMFSKLIMMILVILTFLTSLVASKSQLKKFETMIFVVTFFCLVNPAYLGLPFFTPSYLTDNTGYYWCQFVGIDYSAGPEYCTMLTMQTGAGFDFWVRKYNGDGTINYTSTRGTIGPGYESNIWYRSILYKDGKCKMFYSTNTGTTTYIRFYNGVTTDTDIQAVSTDHLRIVKSIPLTDGSYVSVGWYAGGAYIYKVDPANVGTYVTDANMQYRSVVQYSASNLYVLTLYATDSMHYLKPISTSLVLGTMMITTFDNTYVLQDSIMSSDNNIVIAGYKSTTTSFISKISITASNLWYTAFVNVGTIQVQCIKMKSDGSFIVADYRQIASKGTPFMSSVTNAGTINWEFVYTAYANNDNIFGLTLIDDYSAMLVGQWEDGTKARPLLVNVIIACKPNFTVNAAGTACIIGIFSPRFILHSLPSWVL